MKNARLTFTNDNDFDRFWAAYPRHDGKLAAKRKWDQLHPAPELIERILTALEWQRQQPSWRDIEFVPQASKYLHNARWDDEPLRNGTPSTAGPELSPGAWRCPHRDECPSRWICDKAVLLRKPLKAVAS